MNAYVPVGTAVVGIALAAVLAACAPIGSKATGATAANGTNGTPAAPQAGSSPAPAPSASAATPAASPAPAPAPAPSYQPVTDIPIPPGTKINTERSDILGGPDRWYGRMVLVLDRSTTLAYAYYVEQMPVFGWELVTVVQGRSSTLTYVRGDRAAMLVIGPSGLRASEVAITVSPKSATPPPPPPSTLPPPPKKPT